MKVPGTSYIRVIPRDLFNEASLLKCYGQMYLNLESMGSPELLVQATDTGFAVAQNEDDGSLFLVNVYLEIEGKAYRLWRALNSRRPYPLWLCAGHDDIEVFRDDGSFTAEMLTFLSLPSTPDSRSTP